MESNERPAAAHVSAEEFVWPPPISDDDVVALDWSSESAAPADLHRPVSVIATEQTQSAAAIRPTPLAEEIAFEWDAAAAPVPPLASQPPPRSITTSENPHIVALTLATILAEEIELEWHDAVAIVQQLADQTIADRARGSIPPADRILIEPTGRLRYTLDPAGRESQTRGLGYLLNQLLNGRSAPPALRLLASQAVTDGSAIASTPELMRLLAQFERPKRQERLAELYVRASRAPVSRPTPAPVVAVSRPQAKTPVTEPQPAPTAAPPIRAILAWQRPAAVAILVIVTATAVTLAVSRAGRFFKASPAEASPSVAADSGNQVFELEDRERSPAPNRSAGKGSAPPGKRVSRSTNPVAAPQLPALPLVVGDAASSGGSLEQPIEVPPEYRGSVSRPSAATPANAVPKRNAAVDRRSLEDRIYSAADAGVTEPVLTRPYLPPLPPGVTPESLGVLQVIVDTDGKVESVRLTSGEDAYRDFWWASVAKNWRFRPAMKDGQPVRFLKRLSITDFPGIPKGPIPPLER